MPIMLWLAVKKLEMKDKTAGRPSLGTAFLEPVAGLLFSEVLGSAISLILIVLKGYVNNYCVDF